MATTKMTRHPCQEPGSLLIFAPAAQVTISAAGSVDEFRIEIRTDDETGPSADAVRQARVSVDGSVATVDIPHADTPDGGAMIINSAVFGRTMTIVNGKVVNGHAMNRQSQIEVIAVIPAGSNVGVALGSGSVTIAGQVEGTDIRVSSGTVRIDEVATHAAVQVQWGNISVRHIDRSAHLSASSGTVSVGGSEGAQCRVDVSSGQVIASSKLHLHASVGSGRVRRT